MRDGTGKLPTSDSHVDNEYDIEPMVYNRKMNEKKREEQKKKKNKENKGGWRNTTVERKEEPKTIDHTIRAQPRMFFVFVHM